MKVILTLSALLIVIGIFIYKKLKKPQWQKDLEYYQRLGRLSPEERKAAIARDAEMKTMAQFADFTRRYMKEHDLKSKRS